MIALLRNQGRLLHLSRRPVLRFRWDLLKRIFHIGVPNGIENGIFQLGTILLLSLTSTFGTAAIAANAVSNTVAVFQTLAGEAAFFHNRNLYLYQAYLHVQDLRNVQTANHISADQY